MRLSRFAPLALAGLLIVAAPAGAQGEGFIGIEYADGKFPGPPPKPALSVKRVIPGFPAERAGMKAGDLLFRLDGQEIENKDRFAQAVRARKPGETVTLHLLRDERTFITLSLALGVRPPEADRAPDPPPRQFPQ